MYNNIKERETQKYLEVVGLTSHTPVVLCMVWIRLKIYTVNTLFEKIYENIEKLLAEEETKVKIYIPVAKKAQ